MTKNIIAPIPLESIAQSILLIRGRKVMLDSDLAMLYGVTTKRPNEQVRRNRERFPEDFKFPLTDEEYASLRSQIATSNTARGGRRYRPSVFTEHGAIMAASVLNTPLAVAASIYVVRAFVRLRELLTSNQALVHQLDALERRLGNHDQAIANIFNTLRELMTPAPAEKLLKRRMGFITDK